MAQRVRKRELWGIKIHNSSFEHVDQANIWIGCQKRLTTWAQRHRDASGELLWLDEDLVF